MIGNNLLIFIGSCGDSWPYNTTPIQRALALEPFYERIVYIDKETSLSRFLNTQKSQYFRIKSFKEIPNIIKMFDNKFNISIIHGPSWRISKSILKIRKYINFKWIVDLYDHPNLTSNIYFNNKDYLKFIFHKISESYLELAIMRSDILISAISENKYIGHKNRIKCINGVQYEHLRNAVDFTLENDELVRLGYIGVLNYERSMLILKIIKGLQESKPTVQYEFHLIGDFDKAFKKDLSSHCSEFIKIKFYGFVDWAYGLKILSNMDVCIYTFPIKNRPELDCVYPIKIGEYLALGKHILSVKSSGLIEIIGKIGNNCDITLINESDLDEWIDIISKKALLKKSNRSLFSDTNTKLAKEILSWDKIHEELIRKIQ